MTLFERGSLLIKSSFSLALLALVVSIVLTSLTPIPSQAAGSEQCLELFGGMPTYKRVNSTARMDPRSYPMPNARSAHEYEISLLPEGVRFRDFMKRGAVIIDIGGGQGRAMSELAQALPVHAVVINTQDFSGLHARTRFKGSFEYKAGWAEQVLKEIPSNSVDHAVDLWGGFTYSPNKAEILEEIYRVLKPGGRAFVLLSSKTPAHVEDPSVNYGQPVSLEWYLARKYPDVFSSRKAHHEDLRGAKIIEISKPMYGEPRTVETNLVAAEVVRGAGGNRGSSAFSAVTYGVKDQN